MTLGHRFWLHGGTLLAYIGIHFAYRFLKEFFPVPQRLFLDVPSSFCHAFGSVWLPFDTPWPSFWEPVWVQCLHFRSLFQCRLLHLFPSFFFPFNKMMPKWVRVRFKMDPTYPKLRPNDSKTVQTNWARN